MEDLTQIPQNENTTVHYHKTNILKNQIYYS